MLGGMPRREDAMSDDTKELRAPATVAASEDERTKSI
jgi:hypothetical protein